MFRRLLALRAGPFLAFLVFALVAGTCAAAQTEQAEVTGRVTNVRGGGVMNASVVFASEGHSLTIITAYDGSYLARLVPGTYEMSVRATGFYRMPRAAFTVAEGSRVEFDFELIVEVISDSVFVGSTDLPQQRKPPPHDPYNYQKEYLGPTGAGKLRPLVLFGNRKSEIDSIKYTGLVRDGKQLPVIYTFDLLTVRADSLTYFPNENSMQGEGNVVFQDGEHTQRGSKIEISFRNGKPETRLVNAQ